MAQYLLCHFCFFFFLSKQCPILVNLIFSVFLPFLLLYLLILDASGICVVAKYMFTLIFAAACKYVYSNCFIFSYELTVEVFVFGYKVHKCQFSLAFCGLAYILANYNGFCDHSLGLSYPNICLVYL